MVQVKCWERSHKHGGNNFLFVYENMLENNRIKNTIQQNHIHTKYQDFLCRKTFEAKGKIRRPNLVKSSTINKNVYKNILYNTISMQLTIISIKHFLGNQIV